MEEEGHGKADKGCISKLLKLKSGITNSMPKRFRKEIDSFPPITRLSASPSILIQSRGLIKDLKVIHHQRWFKWGRLF